ncbi:MAG TPA: thiamine pyrophosphate-binding protein [Thermomicrobiaceae bacterium]|nr:thiamine pyrophosphate-binding protein [Thermomicrobiaceae bacterium]
MTERLKGGQAAIRALEAQGVDVVFGIPGVHTLELYDALRDSSIRHVLARHEQGAGFMADGYARASGRPGVAVIITGPGITNVATPVGEAFADSSPVLVLSSNVEQQWAGQMLGHLHDLKDQLGVMAAVTRWNTRATSVTQVPRAVSRAFAEMAAGRPRPTHVEVPLDVLSAWDDVAVEPSTPGKPNAPRSTEVDRAVQSIASARRPVVYCGGGVITSGATPEITELATRLGAPVLTSIMGKGAVSEDHPLALGALWSRGNAVDQLLREADLALVFGSKLGAQETDYQQMPLPANLIRIDVDPVELTRNYPAALAIEADARETAIALLRALEAGPSSEPAWSTNQVADVRERARTQAWGADKQGYVEALRGAIPHDGILVNDMTMMSYVLCGLYPVNEPRTFFFPSGYGTLGFSLPAAIGAKVARPDAVVVAVAGDGGFQYTMQELATAVQFRLGIPIVIFNDSTYTAVKDAQAREYDRRFIAVDLINPDYVKLADAYGIPSTVARTPDELGRAVREASTRDLPTIIDTPIHFDV